MSPICLTYVLLSRFFFRLSFVFQDNSNIVFLKSIGKKEPHQLKNQKRFIYCLYKDKNVFFCNYLVRFGSFPVLFYSLFVLYIFPRFFSRCCCFFAYYKGQERLRDMICVYNRQRSTYLWTVVIIIFHFFFLPFSYSF